jgi:uncharacterized protein YxeA
MAAKNVWAVIIIVIGVFLVFHGMQRYGDADFVKNELKYMDKQITQAGFGKVLNSNREIKMMESEKSNCILILILGIATAIGGTLLLVNDRRKPVRHKSIRTYIRREETIKGSFSKAKSTSPDNNGDNPGDIKIN